jgi:hypothetical protein
VAEVSVELGCPADGQSALVLLVLVGVVQLVDGFGTSGGEGSFHFIILLLYV